MPEIDGFDSLVSKLNQAKKTSEQIEKIWEKINRHAKGTGFGGGSGTGGTGGGTGGPGGAMRGPEGMADAVPSPGKEKFRGSLLGRAYAGLSGSGFGFGDVINYAANMQNSVNTFLPDVTQTMSRATGYYNAGIYGGGRMSRLGLQQATFGTLGRMNALTSEGSDARVAQFLASRGMTASGASGSTYQQTLRTIGNAALSMNISNEEAAASIEGLTSASGAANMLRNFGIYTADVSTGKEKTQGQIFEELAQRLTAGRGQANIEQTQASIRRGALGVTIDAFFKGDQQSAQMFKQYMIERAGGRNMDFSSESFAGLGREGNLNPLRSQMALSTSNTGVMQAAEGQYIKGIEAATGALQLLNVAAAGVSKTILGLTSSFSQLLFGAGTTKGLMGAVSSTVNFTSKGVNALFEDSKILDPVARIAATTYHGAALAGGLLLGSGFAAAGIYGAATAGSDASSGLINPIGGGGTGGQMGLGASHGMAPSESGPGVGPDAGRSGNLFDISIVARGHSVTGSFGSVSSIRGGRPHRGTDYSHSYDPVYAIGDGEVIFARSTYNRNDATGNSAGNYVAILHVSAKGDKYTSLYLHLSKVHVKVGDKVRRGQKIGVSGNTGHSTGPHLHLEIVKGRATAPGIGTAISPSEAQKISGSTTLSDGSMTTSGTYSPESTLSSQDSKLVSSVLSQQKTQLGLLGDLYSGDQARVTGAVGNYASMLGIGDLFAKNYTGTYVSGDVATDLLSGGGSNRGPGGGSTNNNVNIVVQVPDVTSADAIKFATLVKQYLDSNTLMSNTGSI